MSYTYGSLNRLATVVDNRLPAGQQTTTYSYDPASNLATVTDPNGLQSAFTYDTQNRVTGLSNAAASYTYTLDGTVGNRTGVTEQLAIQSHPRIVAWNYDKIYRLTNEDITADPNSKTGSVTYGLDPVGNRLSLGLSQGSNLPDISPIQPGSISYDPDDRLSTETYDANGNTLTTAGKTFAYDFENRLKSMTEGTVTVTIQYDADGNRVAKTVNGVTTRYLVDDLNPTGYAQVVEEVTAGAVTRQYNYGLQRISQTQQIANAWAPAFYGYDGGGTVRLLTDATGTVTDTYDYDAWGNAVNTTGSTPNVYLYRGEQYDSDLSLYYLRARYLNPLTGRFLSRDPGQGNAFEPASQQKYLYADGDPVDQMDPSGWASCWGALVSPLAGGYPLLVIGPLNWPALNLPKPGDLWSRCGGGGTPPPSTYGLKGFSETDQNTMRKAINQAVNTLLMSCCAGDDSPKIAKAILGATYVYKKNMTDLCGLTGPITPIKIFHTIRLGPPSFGPRCCSLASTIAHEGSHLIRYSETQAYGLEGKCFGCPGTPPPSKRHGGPVPE